MYALFTLLAGACQSAMGSLNRMLTDYVGMFGMSLVVHAVGGILLILYMKLFVHEKLKISGMPWYLYSAGFFGIFLVVTSSYCIGVLGVSVLPGEPPLRPGQGFRYARSFSYEEFPSILPQHHERYTLFPCGSL